MVVLVEKEKGQVSQVVVMKRKRRHQKSREEVACVEKGERKVTDRLRKIAVETKRLERNINKSSTKGQKSEPKNVIQTSS